MDDGPVNIPGGFFKNPAGIRVALKVKSQNAQGLYPLAPLKFATWFTLIRGGRVSHDCTGEKQVQVFHYRDRPCPKC